MIYVKALTSHALTSSDVLELPYAFCASVKSSSLYGWVCAASAVEACSNSTRRFEKVNNVECSISEKVLGH